MKVSWVQWVGIGISAFFVVLLVRSLHLEQVGQALVQADYWWLLPAVIFSLVSFIFRSQRFRMFLASLRVFSLLRSYQYIAINYMANNIFPARAGEVLLSYVVKQQESIPVSSSLAVTLLGRVLDGLILLVGLLWTVLLLPFPSWVSQVVIFGSLIFGGVFIGMLWLVFGKKQHQVWIKDFIQALAPSFMQSAVARGLQWAEAFKLGLLPLRSWKISALAIVLSLATWMCEGLVYYLVSQMFHLDYTFIQVIFVLSLANLAASVPSGPAGIGTFEGIIIIGLGLLGVSANKAAAYAVILHATQVLPITIIGILSYFKLSVLKTSTEKQISV